MARDDKADAKCLREAAQVLRARGRKTFAIQVIIRVLERIADKLDMADVWRDATGQAGRV